MSTANHQGDEVVEEQLLFPGDFKGDEAARAVLALANHFGITLVRTNATKHGRDEIEARKEYRMDEPAPFKRFWFHPESDSHFVTESGLGLDGGMDAQMCAEMDEREWWASKTKSSTPVQEDDDL